MKSYELVHGVFPPGDGAGSRDLVTFLERKGPKGVPYFDFSPDMKSGGHVINPVWGADAESPKDVIHYRNNLDRCAVRFPGAPPVMHPKGVDLWASDGKGKPWGINSWE